MLDPQIRLTRAQLAEFLPDSRAIKAVEQLMVMTGTILPDQITVLQRLVEEITIESGSTTANTVLALGLLAEIEEHLSILSAAPATTLDLSKLEDELSINALAPVNGQSEFTISYGTTAQYWRGDKTWRDFMTDVRATTLTGLSTAVNAVITAADTVLSALGKLQKQFSDHFASTVEHGATGAVVGTTNSQTLTNKTLTTPIIAQISNTGTITLPTSTDTLVGKATTDVLTHKTYDTAGTGNVFKINGTTISAVIGSGAVVLATSPTITTPVIAQITNTGTLTLPTSTDTLVGKATTDVFTNKTYDTAGTGNVFKINGTGISAVIGSGSVVLATSPTLTTPALGTPSALVGTNITGTGASFTSGNVTVSTVAALGYITGSGGAVTQITSKATGVTLDKPVGQITMNNAALAAGAIVSFILTNSFISLTNLLVCHPSNNANYRVDVGYVNSGTAGIRITNITAGSLSEAVILNFAVVRGANS